MTMSLKFKLYIALGALAGLGIWALQELILAQVHAGYLAVNLLHGMATGAVFGFVFGILDGLSIGERRKALVTGGIGLGLGAAGGALGFVLAAWTLSLAADGLRLDRSATQGLLLPALRVFGWSVMGLIVGASSGLQSRSLKRSLAGGAGGLLGGLLGGASLELGLGLLAVPEIGRLLGFLVLGTLLGLLIGWFESKSAFGRLRVLTGELKNREYPLFRRKNRIGASWLSEVYLRGLPGLAAWQASVVRRGRSFQLVARPGQSAPLLNDQAIAESAELKYEDVIETGGAKLIFLPLD